MQSQFPVRRAHRRRIHPTLGLAITLVGCQQPPLATGPAKANHPPTHAAQPALPKPATTTVTILRANTKARYVTLAAPGSCEYYTHEYGLNESPEDYARVRAWFEHPETIPVPAGGEVSETGTEAVTNFTVQGPNCPLPPGATVSTRSYSFEYTLMVYGGTGYAAGDIEIRKQTFDCDALYPFFTSECLPGPAEPSPSPTPSGPLRVEYTAFSPDRPGENFDENFDENKDTNTITIAVEPGQPWELVVDGKGNLATGVGPTTIIWDGNYPIAPAPRRGVLKDGPYVLRLRGPGLEDTLASVAIDTKAPRITGIRFDGSENKVIGSVDPMIEVDFTETGDGVASTDDIGLAFSTRRDGVTPAILQSAKSLTSQTAGAYTFGYQVPFEANSILYLGTQTLDVAVTDSAGNQAQRQVSFAVGAHDKHPVTPPIQGYRLAAAPFTTPPRKRTKPKSQAKVALK